MPYTITVGYRRCPDGSAEPVCEPSIDQFLVELWRHAAQVILDTEHCLVVGTLGQGRTFTGTMRPHDQLALMSHMVQEALDRMAETIQYLDAQYAFDLVAEIVVAEADPRLLLCLNEPFVEIDPPVETETGKIELTVPRIEYDGARVRVYVTGASRRNPLWRFSDQVIRDRARDRILAEIASHAEPAD